MDLPCTVVDLECPPLAEVAEVLRKALAKNFAKASVELVDCPDLTEAPFHLASPGLGSKPGAILDVGGVGNLCPDFVEVHYDLNQVVKRSGLPDTHFLLGPGCGPIDQLGVFSEAVTNIDLRKPKAESYTTEVDEEGKPVQRQLSDAKCSLMMNLIATDGERGPVLDIRCEERTGEQDLLTLIRTALEEGFKGTVGVGGTFLLEEGTAKMHIMPRKSRHLPNPEAVNDWLTWHDGPASLVHGLVVVNRDPGLNLRLDHAHCFGPPGSNLTGGHYHWDTTPKSVKYRAVLTVASKLARIGRPATDGF